MKIKIGLVDDHQLFLKSLTMLMGSLPDFEVVVTAAHGQDLKEKLEAGTPLPDILLIDVEMPVMNGIETAQWMRATYPTVRLVALSMNYNEQIIIEMIRSGCCSYLLKDTDTDELERALNEVYTKNYYNADLNKTNLAGLLLTNQAGEIFQVTEKEREFLQHAMGDLTYKQIATLMGVSERTIDGYREALFTKLKSQSRTGMVIEAIRRGLVKI